MQSAKQHNWGDSASGEVKFLVRQLRFLGFLRAVGRDMVLMLGLLVVLFAGYFYFSLLPETKYDLGGILCFEVQQVTKSFASDTLDPETKSKVEVHIDQCPTCHKRVGQLSSQWKHTKDVSATSSAASQVDDKAAPVKTQSEG